MSIRIRLPDVTWQGSEGAHLYPIQIGYQTQEFLQGSIFHAAFMDVAATQYTEMPDSFERIKAEFIDKDMDEATWELSLSCLDKYQEIFKESLYQNVLIAMKSHWDWYISKMGRFIVFASQHVNPRLDIDVIAGLKRIAFNDIGEQIKILERSSGLDLEILESTIKSLREMVLARNLGIHNRWEVNRYYAKHARTKKWRPGELRTISVEELEEWHSNLLECINHTSSPMAKRYASAPEYLG